MVEFADLWRGHPINESVTTPCIAPHELTNMEGERIAIGFPSSQPVCDPVWASPCAARGEGWPDLGCATPRRAPRSGCISSMRASSQCHCARRPSGVGLSKDYRADAPTTIKAVQPAPASSFPGLLEADIRQRARDGRHIDVWNGYRSSAKWLLEWFSWLATIPLRERGEIWFWEVK
jgi:hypothetical protein